MYTIVVAGGSMESSGPPEEVTMKVDVQKRLLAWDSLEDSATIRTISEILASVADGRLLMSLRTWRGRGRNDYPVQVLWGTLVLKVILRHVRMEDCLAELRRNLELRRLIGIEREEEVPKGYNMTRFMQTLGEEPHWTLVQEMFDEMAKRLGEKVGDLGEWVCGDATHVRARLGSGEGEEGVLRRGGEGGEGGGVVWVCGAVAGG